VAGERLLVGSYGSGAQAEIHAETVADDWREEVAALNVEEQLDRRCTISFEEYGEVHDRHNHAKSVDLDSFTDPDGEFVFTGRGAMDERQYAYT
jgi:hydroxymethylglutaryl-CoA synthase